jgi:lysine 2,3-aminomutase
MVENQPWKSSFQEAFKHSRELFHFLGWETHQHAQAEKSFPLFIPRRLAEKIKHQGPNGVLAKEFLPDQKETDESINFDGLMDPIGDKEHFAAPQLIHRYSSRALFTPTSICPVHCRYCFRRNELGAGEELFSANFDQTIDYLKTHTEINELIFTGGDPLTLSNEKLEKYLEAFSGIASIKDIRFHTRYPVILPQRIDQGFKDILTHYSRKFRTLSVAIHANHVDEFDLESMEKIRELSQLNIQLLSQSVLLKEVNNSLHSLLELYNLFIALKVRPYYLHHPDQVKGGLHFYVGLEEGRRLYSQLRNNLPGWALPHYVIDIPGGAGKVGAFNPETFHFQGQLIGRDGQIVSIQEPD